VALRASLSAGKWYLQKHFKKDDDINHNLLLVSGMEIRTTEQKENQEISGKDLTQTEIIITH
jgi:hypothetical protein